MHPSQPISAPTSDVFTGVLQHAPESSEFPEALLGQVRLMRQGGHHEARLHLHPAELGRLSIAVATDGDAARVTFTVDNPVAREALEASLPRLRDLFEASGLELADSSVSEERERGDQQPLFKPDTDRLEVAQGTDDASTESPEKDNNSDSRLLDAYA